MISLLGGTPTLAKDNMNGFLASVLGWLQGSDRTVGEREFEGYRVWTTETLDSLDSEAPSDTCRSALTELIRCDDRTKEYQSPAMRTWLGNKNDTGTVCDPSCGKSLKSWFDGVATACGSYRLSNAAFMLLGGRI